MSNDVVEPTAPGCAFTDAGPSGSVLYGGIREVLCADFHTAMQDIHSAVEH